MGLGRGKGNIRVVASRGAPGMCRSAQERVRQELQFLHRRGHREHPMKSVDQEVSLARRLSCEHPWFNRIGLYQARLQPCRNESGRSGNAFSRTEVSLKYPFVCSSPCRCAGSAKMSERLRNDDLRSTIGTVGAMAIYQQSLGRALETALSFSIGCEQQLTN